MADLNELDRAEAVKIAGANPSTGIADNFMEVDTNGYIGSRLYDASGTALDTNYGTVGAHTLRTASQIGNATGGADFGSGSATAQTLRVTLSNLPTTLDTNYGSVGASTLRTASQIGNATGAANFGAGATGAQTLRVAANTYDGSGNSIASINNQLETRDVLNVSSQYRAQSVTTAAAEALGAATILSNRKLLHITPTNGTIYWGYSSGITTTTGTPLFPNNTLFLSVTDNVHIYVIAGATVDTRVGEVS